MILHWLAAHWLLFASGGIGVLAFLFPAVSLPIARWLLLTERGRYLLLVGVAAWGFLFLRTHYLDAGYSAGVAHEAATTDRAKAAAEHAARLIEQQHAVEIANVAAQYERDKADAQFTHDRVVADLRAGTFKLRDHWRCDVSQTTAGPGERDAGAELRSQGAADLVRLAAEADAQVRAAQAVIASDRK